MPNEMIKLKEQISICLLPKLAKSVDQSNNHPEYQIHHKTLAQQFPTILNLLSNIDIKDDSEFTHEIVSLLLILYEELCSDGPWNTDMSKEFSTKLNCSFNLHCGVPLDSVIVSDLFNAQLLFDICMNKLHENMNSDTLKHYPALIEVYCSVIKNIKEYKIDINPARTATISLLLIDDYINENRIKGLSCCLSILECLSKNHFQNGNYYEVIYTSLKKVIVETDLNITKLVLNCIIQLLQNLPSDIKDNYTDQMYASVLDQLYVESNLYRKALCFNFLKQAIVLHGINCVKKKNFTTIVCDNIDVCSNKDVSDILLKDVLECLETWIKYCWCVWQLNPEKKVLTSLFKILYSSQEQYVSQITNIIITLIKLCTEDEQKYIYKSLEETQSCNENFVHRINIIKSKFNMY